MEHSFKRQRRSVSRTGKNSHNFSRRPARSFHHRSLSKYCGVKRLVCLECGQQVTQNSSFSVSLQRCKYCKFESYCTTALRTHKRCYHAENPLAHFTYADVQKSPLLMDNLQCQCGFTTRLGNRLACHLALCPESDGTAIGIGIAPTTSASDPHGAQPLNPLSDAVCLALGLVNPDGSSKLEVAQKDSSAKQIDATLDMSEKQLMSDQIHKSLVAFKRPVDKIHFFTSAKKRLKYCQAMGKCVDRLCHTQANDHDVQIDEWALRNALKLLPVCSNNYDSNSDTSFVIDPPINESHLPLVKSKLTPSPPPPTLKAPQRTSPRNKVQRGQETTTAVLSSSSSSTPETVQRLNTPQKLSSNDTPHRQLLGKTPPLTFEGTPFLLLNNAQRRPKTRSLSKCMGHDDDNDDDNVSVVDTHSRRRSTNLLSLDKNCRIILSKLQDFGELGDNLIFF